MPIPWILLGCGIGAAGALALDRWRRRRRAAGDPAGETAANHNIAELSQIVGGLAHEIKNPLSTVNVNLKLLGEDLARYADDEHRRLALRLARVRDEANRLREILDDFLRYVGRFELRCVPTDLREIVGALRDFLLPQTEASHVVLRTTDAGGPVVCRVDVGLIKQALLNLMINALQAMDQGGELLVRVSRDDRNGCVEVIDTGPGIPPDSLENVFRAYWSTKKGGSGLGLPTARRIAREHGGSLRVESEVGKGTRFILSLPLDKEKAES